MFPNWHVFTVAEEAGILKTSGELLIQPNYTFEITRRLILCCSLAA